jgi:hypothetical protein
VTSALRSESALNDLESGLIGSALWKQLGLSW